MRERNLSAKIWFVQINHYIRFAIDLKVPDFLNLFNRFFMPNQAAFLNRAQQYLQSYWLALYYVANNKDFTLGFYCYFS